MAYGEDLAYIHDAGFGDFAREASRDLLQLLSRHGVRTGHVVDLGCGSGIWPAALERSGFRVTGIDLSPDMIDLARTRARRSRFVAGSFFDTDLPDCTAVTSLGTCLNYLSDASTGYAGIGSLFRKIHVALGPGGLLVFDVLETARAGRNHWLGEDWAVLLDSEVLQEEILVRTITSFRRVGHSYRRSREVHRLQLLETSRLSKVLREIGFRVHRIGGYGRFRFRQGQVGLIAKKSSRTRS